MAGRLSSDPLFQGLTRPTMILGVSYMYFVVMAMICMIIFINMQSFKMVIIMWATTHLTGYLICAKEPRAIELLILKVNKGFRCLNRGFHGYTNSYDPF